MKYNCRIKRGGRFPGIRAGEEDGSLGRTLQSTDRRFTYKWKKDNNNTQHYERHTAEPALAQFSGKKKGATPRLPW